MISQLKMMHWYRVNGYRGHMGIGKYKPFLVYLYASDMVSAIEKYRGIPGIKTKFSGVKDKTLPAQFSKRAKCFLPDVIELTIDEGGRLEGRIVREGKVSLERARQTWYYGRF